MLDHRAAVADAGPKGLRLGQRRKMLAGAGRGRPAPGGDKVGGVLQAEFFVGRQGFQGASKALRWVQTAHETIRDQLLSR